MFVDVPQELILYSIGAFLVGYLLASISSRLGARYRVTKRDPRDDRIRELEAERDDLSDAIPDSVELIDVAWMLQELLLRQKPQYDYRSAIGTLARSSCPITHEYPGNLAVAR